MKRVILISLISLFGCITLAHAQITKGSITMQMSDMEMPGMEEDMNSHMKGFMGDMKMLMHFKPGYQVTEIKMMGMIDIKQHFENNLMTQYMEMMGQKIMVKSNMSEQTEQLKAMGIDPDKMAEMYQITYDKADKKNIMGYDCYAANININLSDLTPGQEMLEGMEKMNMKMYITEAIQMEQFNLQSLPGFKMNGTPLAYGIDMGMMKMMFEATEINTNPDEAVFEKPEGNYREMTVEELQKMGMGSSGFGF